MSKGVSINGKRVWINNAGTKAIWFFPDYKDWAIGAWSNRGTKTRDLASADNVQKLGAVSGNTGMEVHGRTTELC